MSERKFMLLTTGVIFVVVCVGSMVGMDPYISAKIAEAAWWFTI